MLEWASLLRPIYSSASHIKQFFDLKKYENELNNIKLNLDIREREIGFLKKIYEEDKKSNNISIRLEDMSLYINVPSYYFDTRYNIINNSIFDFNVEIDMKIQDDGGRPLGKIKESVFLRHQSMTLFNKEIHTSLQNNFIENLKSIKEKCECMFVKTIITINVIKDNEKIKVIEQSDSNVRICPNRMYL